MVGANDNRAKGFPLVVLEAKSEDMNPLARIGRQMQQRRASSQIFAVWRRLM
jgi:hypothetical protein